MTGPTTATIGPTNPYAVADTASSRDGSGWGLQEGSGWTSGAGIIDSGSSTVSALCEGSWVDAALSGVALVLDAAATAADPLGSALAAGIGWVIDHLNPIKEWFEQLAGNPGGAIAQSQSWGLIAADLGPGALDWTQDAASSFDGQTGPAVASYLGWADVQTQAMGELARGAAGLQESIARAAGLVGFVHGFLRDVLAEIVGAAVSWAAQAILSFGTLIPWIIGQVGTRVSAVIAKCTSFVDGLVRSSSELSSLLRLLGEWSGQLLRLLDRITPNPHLGGGGGRHAAPPGEIPPFTLRPPDGWGPGGRHAADGPGLLDGMADGVRGGVRDTTVNNLTDGGKNQNEANRPPED